MKIAVVDDIKADRDALSDKIQLYMQNHKINVDIDFFESAEDFLAAFAVGMYQIVFLDIYMNELTGMDAAKVIYRDDPLCNIIFLTASEEYCRSGYSVRAVYYLLKPIDDNEFAQAMQFCRINPEYDVPLLNVKIGGVPVAIHTDSILYISVYGHTTQIHTTERSVEVYAGFSEVTAPLKKDRRFYVCVRGIMVNWQHVKTLEADYMLMSNGEQVPVGRRNKKEIQQAWYNYMYTSMGDSSWK